MFSDSLRNGFGVTVFLLAGAVNASAEPAALRVRVAGIEADKPIAERFAFCAPQGKDGGNKSPAMQWSAGPKGTKSYAIVMVDGDVPQDFSSANKEKSVIEEKAPRRDFYHWVLVNIPADVTKLKEGVESDGVVKTGKSTGRKPYGVRGRNDFGSFMQGTFGGYDGPCPPWNDAKLHRYHFNVYALDIAALNLPPAFGGREAMKAMQGHIVAQGSVTGTYTLNSEMLKSPVTKTVQK